MYTLWKVQISWNILSVYSRKSLAVQTMKFSWKLQPCIETIFFFLPYKQVGSIETEALQLAGFNQLLAMAQNAKTTAMGSSHSHE